MQKKILIWGGKFQSQILHQMILDQNLGIPSIIYDSTLSFTHFLTNAKFLNNIDDLLLNIKSTTHFAIGIGNEFGYARATIGSNLEKLGLTPLSVMHPLSFQDKGSEFGVGLQAMPHSIVHKFCSIGDQVILNTNATIDHHCILGNGVHVMGAAAIAGSVKIGNYATIGTNATILPNLTIGEGAYIGAGAVITKNVPPFSIITGNPGVISGKTKPTFFKKEIERICSIKLRPE
jgi:sugar O-acyltransferase (sialic acid O-acetyltransferase NeuD family)